MEERAEDALLRPAAMLLYLDKGDQLICIGVTVRRSDHTVRVATGSAGINGPPTCLGARCSVLTLLLLHSS